MLSPGSACSPVRSGVRFAIFDLDGTLHPESLGVLLVKELRRQGVSSGDRTVELFDFLHGLAPARLHDPANVRTAYQMYAKVLEGCSQRQVEQVARQTWEQAAASVYPYAEPLLDRLRERGVILVLISGSPQEVVSHPARSLRIGHSCGATLETSAGRYTGVLAGTPAMPGQKAVIATRLLGGGHNLQHAMAVGNSSSDLELLARVSWPIAFEPDAKLRAAATRQGWPIVDRSSILTHIPPKKNEGPSQE